MPNIDTGHVKRKLMTEQEVADMLQLAVQTLRNDRHMGKGLPYIKLGRAVRYDPIDVYASIENQKIVPGA